MTSNTAHANIAIQTAGLTKIYGTGTAKVTAVNDVTLNIFAGQFTSIMGASGSGKSTLLHMIAGLDTVTAGEVVVAGKNITKMNDKQLSYFRRDHIGFVFQAFNLLPTMSAEQNILLPTKMAGGKVDRQWFNDLTGALGLSDRLSHRPYEMSGGQQQRVAVARALLNRPAVLIADEPTGNLDTQASAEVLGLLRDAVKNLGQTVVMVTHDDEAASYGDRIIEMQDGRVIADSAVKGA